MEEGINQDMKLSVNEKLNFEQAITILKTKNLELLFFRNREEKIKQLRFEQFYNVLQTKISAYWEGVLQVYGDEIEISPIVIIDHLLQGGNIYEKKQ